LLPAHGCDAEQPPAQTVPAQVFGEQLTVWTAGQAPAPLQVAASVAVPPVQLADRHDAALPG
jgi:hypothetical protein